MSRPIDESVTKLVAYRRGEREADFNIDVLAIHGKGAHPDDTWCSLRAPGLDVRNPANYTNWLKDQPFLPSILPKARIMRYGYESQWVGPDRLYTSPRTIVTKLLPQLCDWRSQRPRLPLVIIAHSFGGLVAIQLLLDACSEQAGPVSALLYPSTIAIIFFGTPFRYSEASGELTRLAKANLGEAQVIDYGAGAPNTQEQPLSTLVLDFMRKVRTGRQPETLCVYEQKPTKISSIIDKELRRRHEAGEIDLPSPDNLITVESIWVSSSAAVLETAMDWPRARTHLDLNKFADATSEDFDCIARFLREALRKHHRPISLPVPSENSSSNIQQRRWAQLQDEPEGLIPNADSYWHAMTVGSFLTYQRIYADCPKVNNLVFYDALLEQISTTSARRRLQSVWQRLAPIVNGLQEGPVLAILYMMHAESKHRRRPQDESGKRGAVAELRKKQINRWASWTTCHCEADCRTQWNFANDNGQAFGASEACQVYMWRLGRSTFAAKFRKQYYAALKTKWYCS